VLRKGKGVPPRDRGSFVVCQENLSANWKVRGKRGAGGGHQYNRKKRIASINLVEKRMRAKNEVQKTREPVVKKEGGESKTKPGAGQN